MGNLKLNHECTEEEKRGLVRRLRPDFRNPLGATAKLSTKAELRVSRAAAKRSAKRGAKTGAAQKAEKRVWPKDLPQQVAAVRDLLGETGSLDLAAAKASFKGAKEEALVASLDSLAALGLAVSAGTGDERSWSAVR